LLPTAHANAPWAFFACDRPDPKRPLLDGRSTDVIHLCRENIGGAAGIPALVTIDASDASGNPLDQTSGFDLVGSLMPSGPFGAGEINSANENSIAAIYTDLIPRSAGNSAVSGNSLPVPEPSTFLLALVAILGLVSTQFVRHHFRCQTVRSA
jgi:hypothetical protein